MCEGTYNFSKFFYGICEQIISKVTDQLQLKLEERPEKSEKEGPGREEAKSEQT